MSLSLILRGHRLVEQKLALAVEAQQSWNVGARVGLAVKTAQQPFLKQCEHRHRESRRHLSDRCQRRQHHGPALADDLQRLTDHVALGNPNSQHGRVGHHTMRQVADQSRGLSHRSGEMGRSEYKGLVAFAICDIDHHNLFRPGQPRTLDRTATDAAAADHHDGVARAHLGGVDR